MSDTAGLQDEGVRERAQAKLQAFYDSLPDDERAVVTAALVKGAGPHDEPEVSGFAAGPMLKVKIDVGQAQQAGVSTKSMYASGYDSSGGGGGGSSTPAPAPTYYWWWWWY